MNNNLFYGKLVRLSAENPETYAEHFSRWVRDSEYGRLLDLAPIALYSPKRVKEWLEKELEKDPPEMWMFGIRALEDDKLIGFVDLNGATPHGDTFVGIGIGEREYWGKGYGTEAMKLVLRFAFLELGLHRVSLDVFDYNPRGVKSYEKAGFRLEGRAREMILREGQRRDVLFMGVLREDWIKQFGAEYGVGLEPNIS
jgi:RimJ/RimL family protein N-acetyltransferase